MAKTAVVLFSGGLDSAVLAARYIHEGYEVHCLCMAYGQKNIIEKNYAEKLFNAMNRLKELRHIYLEDPLRTILGASSALLKEAGFTPVELAEEDISARYVPVRNAMFLSMAWAYGLTLKGGCDIVSLGSHVGLNATYPDCTPEFLALIGQALREGSRGQRVTEGMRIEAPFTHWTKADIVEQGAKLRVPLGLTWSCFSENYDRHCGLCATCQARKKAFAQAEVVDPTLYDEEEGAYRG